MRLGATFADGERAAVSTWNGDVWIVSGVNQTDEELTWRQFAAGLFQPLGVRVIDTIYVGCLNLRARGHQRRRRADYYCLNNDHQVTERYEFAMGCRRTRTATSTPSRRATPRRRWCRTTALLKVSKDGSETTIVANGFRAANGVNSTARST